MKNDSQSRRRLVERAEDSRIVGIAGAALEQRLGLLAAVAAEVRVQQVDHRPQVPALLDVDLEQVAQVVERRAGEAEAPLLLDRRGLGVALRDDQPPQVCRGTRPALPATRARPCARRSSLSARARPARGRFPTGSPAFSRSRSAPSPWARRSRPCAGRRRCSRVPSGPVSAHQLWNSGCHFSRARCSVLLLARSTLFGIFSL